MATKESYSDWLKKEMNSIIDNLELADSQKTNIKSRWLDQVVWMEGKAKSTQKPYYLLRLIVIIGGIIVPSLVSFQFENEIQVLIRWITFGISLSVAISAAIEGFINFGERWQHYRGTVEVLKSEGWQFIQLSGRYENYKKHQEAYPRFADQVEQIIREDVKFYFTEIVKDKKEKKDIKDE
ncbi:DUF4231 domain-containing protein [candidate division KSB1 bacterium]|nr:DUF4231 domain-containing protein [candidate division KSB1 bacterium]